MEDVLTAQNERLELAYEIVDGPCDADWDAAWLAELDRRAVAAQHRGDNNADWNDVRARILERLGRA